MTSTEPPRTYNGDLADPPKALEPLCFMPHWVTWRWQQGTDGKAWTKPPFRAADPDRHAANNDPSTWSPRPAAVAAVLAGKANGIGFVLTNTEIAAVDLDKCRDLKTGAIDAWAQEIVDAAPGAYVEATVGGAGLRIIGIATGTEAHRRFSVAGREGAGVEVYRRATRYVTVSGLEIGKCAELPNIDALIDDIIADHDTKETASVSTGAAAGGNGFDDIDSLIKHGAQEGQRSEAFARCVWSLAGQGLSEDEIEKELGRYPDGIGAKYGKRLRREVERCYTKWQQQGQRTAAAAGVTSSSPHTWDDPDTSILDDRRGELPEFPLDVLSPPWQEWATNAAHGAGCAVDHVMVPLLAVASSLIGTARRVQASKSWSEPMTCWTAIVGASGAGKTPGLDVSKRALALIEQERQTKIAELRRAHETNAERAKAKFKAWKDAVEEATKKGLATPPMPSDADVPDDFVPPRLFVADATVQKLAVLLQARPCGTLLINDELAALFLNMTRYANGGSDREFWLESWNGKSYPVERMGRTLSIPHLLIGITGGFQPDKLARSFKGDADGLYTRLLFGWPAKPPYRPLTDAVEEVEPEFMNSLIRLIDLTADDGGDLIVTAVPLTAEARASFEEFRKDVHAGHSVLDGREGEWWAKMPAHVLRLAGTLAYLDWARRTAGQPIVVAEPNKVEKVFLDAAVRLVRDYFWPHARAALRQIGLSEHHANARKVLLWLQVNNRDEVSREEVRRTALTRSLDADTTERLLATLVRAGWLRLTTNLTGGRPSRRWQVNPKLLTDLSGGKGGKGGKSLLRTLSALPALSAGQWEQEK
jgi:hypothetical protein